MMNEPSQHILSDRFRPRYVTNIRPPRIGLRLKESPYGTLKESRRKNLLDRLIKFLEHRKREETKRKQDLQAKNPLEKATQEKKINQEKKQLKSSLREMLAQKSSASMKEGMIKIMTGHMTDGLADIRATGQEGAIGNKVARAALNFSRSAQKVAKLEGKNFNSVMYKMLRDHSVPADSIRNNKDQNKGDQNLEGRITKESTQKQMSDAYLKRKLSKTI